jgi:hypothetical protein
MASGRGSVSCIRKETRRAMSSGTGPRRVPARYYRDLAVIKAHEAH